MIIVIQDILNVLGFFILKSRL